MGRTARTLWHTTVYAMGFALNRGVAFLLIPFYTRALSTHEFAVWGLCTAAVLFLVPCLEVSLGTGVLRFYYVFKTDPERRRLFGSAITFLAGVFVLALILGKAFSGPLSLGLFGDRTQGRLITLIILTSVMTALSNQPLALMRAQEKSAVFAVVSLLRAVVGPSCIVVLVAKLHWGVEGVLWGDLAGLAAMVLAGLAYSRRYLLFGIDRSILKRVLGFALPLVPVGVATALVAVSDRPFIRELAGMNALAVYDLGCKVAMIMTLLTRAFQTAWPASAFQIAEEPRAPETFGRLFGLMMLAMCGAALVLTAFSRELVALFGPTETYGEAYRVVPWISFSYVLFAGLTYTTTGLAIIGKTGLASLIVCLGAVVKLGLNLPLIKSFGVMGGAYATMAAVVVQLALAVIVGQRYYPIRYEIGRLVTLFALILGTIWSVTWVADWQAASGLALRVAVLGCFGGVSLLAVLKPKEREALWRTCVHCAFIRKQFR